MAGPDTEYQVTPKGEEMAQRLASTRGMKNLMGKSNSSSPEEIKSRITKTPNKDPNYTNVSAGIARPLKINDTVADILAKMYNFMKKKYERDSKDYKKEIKYRKSLVQAKERRIEELISLFNGKYRKSYFKDSKKEKFKEGQKKEKTVLDKAVDTAKTTIDTVKNKALSVFKKGTDVIKKTAPVATKVAPNVAKIAVGGAAVVGLSSIANIAKAESSGDPNQMNITSTEVRNKNTSSALVVPGNIDITTGKKYDKKLTDMSMGEVYELGQRRNKQLNGGGAAGKYQFEPNTMKIVASKEFGNNWTNEKFSESNQEKLMQRFTSENALSLKKSGIAVTDQSLYAMHFTGSIEKTRKIVEGADSTKMSEILGPKASSQNKRIANLTVGEYRAELTKKGFSNKESSIPEIKPPPTIKNTPPSNIIPEKINSKPNNKSSSVSMLNKTTNIINGGVTYASSQDSSKSTAPLIDLQYG